MRALLASIVVVVATSAGCGSADKPGLDGSVGRQADTATPGATATAEPAGVFRAFVDAINRGDSTAAEALLAADATWERGGQCPPGQCRGLDRLRQEISRDIAAHHRIDVLSTEAGLGSVTARIELRTDQTRAAGVERVIQVVVVNVSEGRITAVVVANDLSDEITAAFVERRRGQ